MLPRDDELHVDDVHVRHAHGARLFRDCRPHGVWLPPYDGGLHARDVRQLEYDVQLLVLTFRPPSNLYSLNVILDPALQKLLGHRYKVRSLRLELVEIGFTQIL